jgi:dephospho-CoA kinase
VDNSGKKQIIGILGGIGSGKSAAAAEFARLGCAVIDADKIAHELLDKKTVQDKIVALFGKNILDSSGKIGRSRLADIVFADADKLSSLNRIIHPPVLERAEQLIKRYNRQSQVKAIVLDMPLLAEAGWAKRCDRLIFVDCDRQVRVNRARKINIHSKNHKIRENFQISLDNKAKLCDNIIINNNSDFPALVRQVADVFSRIVNNR